MLTLTSPVRTWAHPLPAGAKLLALCGFTVLLFALKTPAMLALAAAFVAALIAVCGRDFAAASLRLLRPLGFFITVVGVWHLWLGDIHGGAVVILRMITAVAAANFVTMTTRLSDMIAVIEWLCRPLARIGLSPKTLALAVALVIRFIPVMLQRMAQIRESWRARSHRRPGWRVMLPATLAALDDADRTAEALRARGGSG